jgi:hypothetical protein
MDYQSQINDLQKQINHLRDQIKTEPQKTEVKSKRFTPQNYDDYYYVCDNGEIERTYWNNNDIDNYRYSLGNCYPLTNEGEEQALWEQVTRCKYEQALWDAADWVDGSEYWGGFYHKVDKKINACCVPSTFYYVTPRFATEKSAIEAHKRILGDDAERYFSRR